MNMVILNIATFGLPYSGFCFLTSNDVYLINHFHFMFQVTANPESRVCDI